MYRILYVDDERGLLDIGKLFLEEGGQFSVDTITSAAEALALLSAKDFDAIISDYQMPGMDGIGFLKKVRASGNTIPFILFTGRGREEVVIQALNEGADFYLQKGGEPVAQFAELAHKIRQAVQQRQAQASIRDHERREADIINFLPDATFAIDNHGVVIAWNRAMEDFSGVFSQEILGKGNYEYALPIYHERRPILIDLVLKDDPATEAKYPDVLRSGKKIFSEIFIPDKNSGAGALIWFTASPLYDTKGTIVGAIESIRDITDRKRAEDKLGFSERKFAAAFDASPDPMAITEVTTGALQEINQSFETWSGYSRDEIIGKTTRELHFWVYPEEREAFVSLLNAQGDVHKKDVTFQIKSGEIRNISFSAKILGIGDSRYMLSVAEDITERKMAEKALRESEEKYRTVLENIQDVFYRSDTEGRLIMASPSWAALLGYGTLDECLGHGIAEKFYYEPETRRSFLEAVQTQGRVDNYQVVLKRKDGRPVQVSTNSHLYFHEDGSPAGVEGIFRDITPLKKAQDEISQKSRILSIQNTLITSANRAKSLPELMVVFLDTTLRLLDYEAGGIYLIDEVTQTASLVHAKNIPETFLTLIRTVAVDQKPYDSLFVRGEPLISDNYEALSQEAAKSGFSSIASVPLVAGDRIIGALNVASTKRNTVTGDERSLLLTIGQELGTTISRMTAERQEKLARDEWERTFNAVPDLISIIDTSHTIRRVNRAMAEKLGMTTEQAIGLTCYQCVHGTQRPPDFCPHSLVLRDQQEHTVEIDEGRLGGYFLVSCTPLHDNEGRLLGSVHVARDITLLKQKENILLKNTEELRAANEQIAAAEEELQANVDELGRQEIALRESKKELEDIISFLPDATFAIDRNGRVIAWNQAIEKMTGIPAEKMVGKGNYEYALPFYGERRPILIDLIFKHDSELKNYSTVRRDGTTLIAETGLAHLGGKNLILWGKASPLFNAGGEIIGAIESIRDFTERRRLEDSLNQLNRKLKLLSSVTRHDIINNISVCKGYLALSKTKSPDAEMQKFIAGLEDSVGVIQSQIEFTRVYQDLGAAAPVWQDIQEILGKCSAVQKIPVESDIANLEILGDPLFGRVFYNLHDNTVRHGVHASVIHVHAEKRGDDMVIVWEDNGIGVPHEEKEGVFEQGIGKNTGLGLFLVREILDITGITIRETGEPGKGARFEIAVPEGVWRSGGKGT